MKKHFLILFLAIICQVNCQTIDSAWVTNNYSKVETLIAMRDGTKLFTCIYSPKNNSEKHPFLMMRTPYSCAPYGKDQFSARLYTTNWANYLKENYIIVMQDVRGKYMSEGEFMDVRPFNPNKKGKELYHIKLEKYNDI